MPPAADLLAWYARHRRDLPWRAAPGASPDPYRVWLSEIMLQQTTVAAVRPYYARFLDRFPTLQSLAAATEAELLPLWAGLGYYARARNLLACARRASAAGGFPPDIAALEALPGIGPYTARAIAAIAFAIPAIPVDGNVERVAARLFAFEEPLPAGRPRLARLAARLGDDPDAIAAPSDFAQALFDLGATLCTPRAPACALCPWRTACAGHATGRAASLPARSPKSPRAVRHAVHFALLDRSGRILLRRRPPGGLFGGLSELPGTPFAHTPWTRAAALAHAPAPADWQPLGEVAHGLTHRELHLALWRAETPELPATADGFAVPLDALDGHALSSLMRKCLALLDAPRTDGPAAHAELR